MAKEALRVRDVINGLRALVKKTPQVQSLDLNEAIREVFLFTDGEAQQNNISVEMQLAEGLPFVPGDRVQLQQVILNLVVNAIEAMRSLSEVDRRLLICTRKAEPGGVLVEVQDTGPGLAPVTVDRLFEHFYTAKPNGLGLGLSISPVDYPGTRRTLVGEPQSAAWRHLSLYSACAARQRPAVRCLRVHDKGEVLPHEGLVLVHEAPQSWPWKYLFGYATRPERSGFAGVNCSLSAIRDNSGRDDACILRITWPR